MGYAAPPAAATLLSQHVPHTARVLDAGVGTGLVGECLKPLGFEELVGVDLSEVQIRRAAVKSIYNELYVADLEDMRDRFPEPEFDSAICVGTLGTHCHVGTAALDELIRVTRVGGVIVCALRDDLLSDGPNGMARAMRTLEITGALELIDTTQASLYAHRVSDSVTFRCWAWRVLGSGIRGPFVTCS
eukprot:FR738263.1.p1 GENE.FR738263.1~~FR738263.1.p1  ORF type:complete len:188 (+),score=12.97 FR738263.1:1-564(+)